MSFDELQRHVCGNGVFNDIVTDDIRDAIRERMPAHLWIDTDFGSESPPRVLLTDTLVESLRGTPFARAWHDDYILQDGVRVLDAIAKYPCIEYLTKLGMTEFLVARLDGNLPGGLINWRGRSMEKVLGISRQRLGELKAAKIKLHPRLLLVFRYCDRNGIRISVRDAEVLARLLKHWAVRDGERTLDDTLHNHQLNRRAKAIKYIARMTRADMEAGIHHTSLREFRDYWAQCVQLGDDMNDDAAVFPRDIHERHERYSQRIRALGNAEKDEQITQRYDELNERFGFEFGGLILRPAASGEEVIREGQVLGHCVGGYVDRYAEGKTVICVLRRAVEPDAPWRTVEISPAGGYVVQDRGYKNDRPGGIQIEGSYQLMLNLFWEAWGERKKGRKIA